MTDVDFPDALPAGHRLHWYVLERVLGQGGFGITYLAHDSNLDRPVAIKEYLPTEIARRRADGSARPHTESHGERYAWGLERFLAEARTLARFDHPNIVRVLSVFEANNTAYMVMRFEEGEDLATLLDRRGTLTERQLTDCLLPVLDGLEQVHATGFIHRDIKPENIYVRKDGSPVLLDFGSARQSFGSAKTMTILVAPGYAPLEQYYGDAATQGPWTDIYALGATCYRAIAGQAPLDAVARAKGVLGSAREMLPPAVVAGRGRYSERLLEAVDHALRLSEKDRPQDIAEWRREIVGPAAAAASATSATSAAAAPAPALPEPSQALVAPPTTPMPAPSPVVSVAREEPRRMVPPRRAAWLWGGVAGLCAIAAIVFSLWPGQKAEPTQSIKVAQVPASPATPLPNVPASAVERASSLPSSPRVPDATTAPVTPPVSKRPDVVEQPSTVKPVPESKPPLVVTKVPPPDVRSAASAPPQAPSPGTQRAASGTGPASRTPTTPVPETPAPAPASAVSSVVIAALAAPTQNAARASSTPSRSARDEQIDTAEAALRRGETANAVQMLTPLANAGVPRAQTLLGRAREASQQNFAAYLWYGIAARNGQADAQSLRVKVGAKLQEHEIRQADQLIDRWKPGAEPASERTTP